MLSKISLVCFFRCPSSRLPPRPGAGCARWDKRVLPPVPSGQPWAAPVPPGAEGPAGRRGFGGIFSTPGGPCPPPRPPHNPRPAPRALRAREPGAGGDWLRGAPRGPPGRGRPQSAIHGAARLHAPSLIHKKTSFIKAAAAAAAAGPGAAGRLGRCGAAAPRLCGKRRRRRRNIQLFLDYGAEGLCSETVAGSCRRCSVFFLKYWFCA